MAPTTKKLETIARNLLGIPTLACRNMDSLDFHELGVASIRDALSAAYAAGMKAPKATTTKNRSKTNANRKRPVDAAYEQAHLAAQNLITRLSELLYEMPAPGNEEQPVDWGHVGSIEEVNRILSEVIAFMTNSDE